MIHSHRLCQIENRAKEMYATRMTSYFNKVDNERKKKGFIMLLVRLRYLYFFHINAGIKCFLAFQMSTS
jgi:hypothetical protein